MTAPTLPDKLRDILDLAPLLPSLLTTRSAPSTGRATKGSHSPAPLRLDVEQLLDPRPRSAYPPDDRTDADLAWGDHRQGLLPDLADWAHAITREQAINNTPTQLQPPDLADLASIINYILGNTAWITEEARWADAFEADVHWWWQRCRQLVDEARPDYAPTCEREGCGWWCEPITTTTPDHVRVTYYQCKGCGTIIDHGSRLRRLAEPLVTLHQAAAITGAKVGTLKQWHTDGLLIPVETAPVKRYLLADVRRAVADPPKRGRPANVIISASTA